MEEVNRLWLSDRQSAASNMKDELVKRVREKLSEYDLEQFILTPSGRWATTLQSAMDDLVTELEGVEINDLSGE